MAEINVLKDSNQLFDDGSSFNLTKDDLFSLMDNNTYSDIVLIGMGGDDLLKLKANIGSRYFIKNIKYYINVPVVNGITMEYSANDTEYTTVTPVLDIDTSSLVFTVDDYIQYVRLTHSSPPLLYSTFNPKIINVSSSTTDTYGSTHIYSSSINDIFYYDSSDDSWITTSTKSWFTESPLINFRGRRREFPPHVVIVATSSTVDLIDVDKNELWMRFNTGSSTMLGSGVPYKIFAINGCIYVSMQDSSLVLLDFYNDTSIKFTSSGRFTGNKTIAQRGSATTYTSATSTIYPSNLMTNSVNQIRGAMTDFGEMVAIATISGVSVIMEKSAVFNCTDGTLPTTTVAVSRRGNLYWGSKNEVSEVVIGEVSYKSSFTNVVSSGTGVSNYFFTRDSYFDGDTNTPYLLNEDITSLSVV